MAYIRSGNGGGGGMTKTVLWTNPSTTMGATTITLSDNASNYDYLGIHFQGRTNYTPTETYDVLIPIETWNRSSSASADTKGPFEMAIGYKYNGSNLREVYRVSDTEIYFSKRSGSYSDGASMPLEIYGLKV